MNKSNAEGAAQREIARLFKEGEILRRSNMVNIMEIVRLHKKASQLKGALLVLSSVMMIGGLVAFITS